MQHILKSWQVLITAFGVSILGACAIPNVPDTGSAVTLAPEEPFNADNPQFINTEQEVLYSLIVANLAAIYQQYSISAQHYATAARIGHHIEAAEHAARLYLHNKEYAEAEQAAQVWISLDPDQGKAYQLAAVAAVNQDKMDVALAYMDQFLSHASIHEEQEWQFLSALFEHNHEEKNGLTLAAKLAVKYPHNMRVLLMYAVLLLENDKPGLAQDILEQILAKQPTEESAISLYLQVLQLQKKDEQAATWLQNILKRYPDQETWRENYAQLLAKLQRPQEALAQYRKLSKDNPDKLNYLYALGMLSLSLENFTESRRYFQKLLQKSNTRDQQSAAHYFLAQLEEQAKRVDQALQHYRTIHEDSRYYLSAQARSVLILKEHGRDDEALAYIHTANARTPDTALALRKLEAELLIQEKSYLKALEVYNNLLKEYPEDTDLLYLRGMVGGHMNDIALLESDMRHVLEINPDDAEALNALGYTLADETERYQEAHQLITRALKLQPDSYHILDSMGWVLYRMGKYDEAVEYLRRALEKRDDPEIAAHLGEVLWVSGQQNAAREVWEKARRSFPEDERLSTVMKRFLESDAVVK